MPDHEPEGLIAFSTRLYRLLLALYPRAHRREYGPLMAQAFRDLCREAWPAGSYRALAGLWARTLVDLLRTAAREHLAGLAQGGALMIENRPVRPLPCWQAIAAALPGLAVLACTGPGVGALGRLGGSLPGGLPLSVRSVPTAILALAGLLIGVDLIRRRRFPAWGLPALGLTFGLALAGPWLALLALPAAAAYLALRRPSLRGLPLWAWGLLAGALGLSFLPLLALRSPLGAVSWWSLAGVIATLGVIALGVPLARRYGLAAGLALAGAGYALWARTFHLTYGLAHTFWGEAMLAVLGLWLLVVAPVWVLRARSARGQAWGLLVPAGVALAGVVAMNTLVRTDPRPLESLLNYHPPLISALDFGVGVSYGRLGRAYLLPLLVRDGLAVVQLLLALLLAVAVYGRVGVGEGEAI